MIVILALTALPVLPAYAAVGISGQWAAGAIIDTGAGASPHTGAYTVPAGTDRLLVVAVTMEYTGVTAHNVSVTYGGQALTLITQTTNQQQTIWVGYLNNAGIVAASSTTVSVTHNNTNFRAITVHAATYNGVHQTTPIAGSNSTSSNNANSLGFGANIPVTNEGYIFYVTNHNGDPATPPVGGGYTEHFDQTYNSFDKSVASKAITVAGTENRTVNFAGGDRCALSVVSLNPAPVLPVAPTSFSSSAATTFTVGISNTFNVTANGTPAPTYAIQSVPLPSGVNLSVAGVLNGIPAALTVGSYARTIRATNASGFLDQNFTLTVAKANTTIAITSDNPDPSLVGQNVTVNFSITSAGNTITPTGNVTISDGVNSCTGTVAGAASPFTGSCILALTTVGPRTLTASYPGDANFNAPTNATNGHTVNASFTVTASASAGGAITPAGAVVVTSGGNQAFDITPNAGFVVADVVVGPPSVSQGRVNSYTFTNVLANHTISASFDGEWSFPAADGGGSWGNEANGYTSNNQRATGPFFAGSVDYFNFNIPAIPAGSIIDGIEVAVEGSTTGSNVNVSISPNGTTGFASATAIPTTFTANASEATDVLGSPSNPDVWGNAGTWTLDDFTNANFRLRISAVAFSNFSLDQVQVKVHYRQPTTLTVGTATGVYGGTTTLTAHLATTVGNTPISGQTINFFLNGNPATPIGSAVTNINGDATLNNVDLSGINVGVYAGTFNTSGVGASYAGTAAGALPGYLLSTDADVLTVTKAVLTVTANDKTRVYGAADPVFNATITGFQNGETLLTSDVTGNPVCTSTATANSPVTGSPYPITCVIGSLASNNYSFTFVQSNLDITSAALLITASDDTMVYGGTVPTITPIYTGLQAGDTAPATAPTCSTTATSASPVGSYPSSCAGAADPNYMIGVASYVDGTVTVTPVAITVKADPQTKVYSAADPALTYQITIGALVGTDNFTGALTRVAGEDVGAYAILQGTLALSSNYTLNFVSDDLTITTLAITVTADPQTKVYGTADPALTYQVTSGALLAGDNFTGALTRLPGEDVGLYAIQQGTLTAGGNYALTYVGDNLQITTRFITVTADPKAKIYGTADPALTYQITSGSLAVGDNFTGVLTRVPGENVGTYAILQGTLALTGNYILNYVGDDLTITNQAITVTADPQTKIYGTADPALTYQITSGTLAVGDNFTGALIRAAGEDVGAYAIQQGTLALSGNYTLIFVSDDLTITERAITVTADPQTKVYGDVDPALTYQITSGALVGIDNFTGALTRVAGEDVGAYAIQKGTLALSGNYTLNFVSADLTITTLAITVTADPQTKVYGSVDPALTYQITAGALVGTDNFTGALTRLPGEDVGTYAIQQGTLALSSNYALAYVGDNLTITKRPIEVTAVTDTKAYDGNTSSTGLPTITSGTLIGTDAFTLTQTFDTKDIGITKALIPLAVISVGDANNYLVTYVNNNTGVIAGITVTVSNITANNKVYDGDAIATLNTGTAQLNGVAVGDDVQLVVAGATGAFNNKNVGNGKAVTVTGLVLTGADAANYGLIAPTGITANITTRPITVTAQTNTKIYDGNTSSAAAPIITAGTLAAGDTENFTQAYANQNVGTSKTLTPTGDVTDGNGGGNYLVTFVNDTTGVITAQPLTITADAKAKAFGDPDPALTYSITNGALVGADSLSGSLTRVAGEAVGSCAILQGSLSAGPNYNVTYAGANLTISIVNQTITVITPAPANAAFNSNFNVTATASSGLPVAITTTGAACTGTGSTTATIIMLSGTGVCTIHFNQAGDINFGPALEVIETTTAQKADQTIGVNTPAPANATFNTGFNVAATATSGLPVAYSAGGVCTNVGSNFTVTSGTGVCTVQYNQAGNANYNAAPQVTNTTNAQKANQTINVTISAPATAAFGSNFTVAANSSSGLAVVYSASGSCTNAGATYTMTLPSGVCTVQYNQAGNANYNAAPQVTQPANAQKANQTITVTTPAPASAPFGTVSTVAANSSSGLAVTYTSAGSCSNAGATFTVTSSSGSCTVIYNQAGNANYNAAPQITEFTNSLLTNQTINVTTPAPANAVVGSNFTVAATASSGLPVAYSALGSCTNVGTTFTMTASTGTCTVQYNQAGNINFNPAPQVTNAVNAQKANQSITVTTPAPATAANGTNFTVAATASSGLPVVYSATGTCTNVGGTFTMTGGAGTCTVHYNQAGNVDYNAAPELTSSVTSQAGSQTINVTTSAPASAANGTSFNVAATSSSGLAVAIITSGDCSGIGTGSASITITGAPGTCTVHYNQAGNANYSAAVEVTEDTSTGIDASAPTVTVNQAATQVNDPTNASPINFTVVFNETVTGFTNADVTIGGTAGATNAVITGAGPTYNVAISGMTGDGTVIISIPANAAADASSNGNTASTSTDNTVTYLDGSGPNVQVINTAPSTSDQVLSNAERVTFNITQFTVQFNQDVYNPAGDSDPDDVTNPNNYLLIRDLGDTAGLQTASCAAGAVVPADTKITTGTVSYDNETHTATFTVNGGLPLSNGDYHLFVCGTTSIVDPLNNALALVGSNGPASDLRRSFTVSVTGGGGGGGGGGAGGGTVTTRPATSTLIPVTGFDPNKVTLLPIQPADKSYKALDNIRIEIPTLGINYSIVGVSLNKNNWDLTWLKDSVGYLEGSAYPTFNGNTVLTAHVKDANKNAGPFSDIKGMQLGDRILLHAYGKIYVYEVQENLKISPNDISAAFKHQEYSWITLVTCEDYNAKIEEYHNRRMVRAVLISVVSAP